MGLIKIQFKEDGEYIEGMIMFKQLIAQRWEVQLLLD